MTEFIKKRVSNVRNDVLSGITVALALVPEAVAFAFVAGVDPLVGLYAAFMVGLITSISVSYTHLTLPTNTNACRCGGWAGH